MKIAKDTGWGIRATVQNRMNTQQVIESKLVPLGEELQKIVGLNQRSDFYLIISKRAHSLTPFLIRGWVAKNSDFFKGDIDFYACDTELSAVATANEILRRVSFKQQFGW